MELISQVRRLQVLAEVADRGSFSAAAASLEMTQSAVSQHVSALERTVGMALVDRTSRPPQLTEAGIALVRHTRAVLTRLDAAEQDLAAVAGRRRGRVRLGAFPTALATFVPPALAAFKQRVATVTLGVVHDHMPTPSAPSSLGRTTWPGRARRSRSATCRTRPGSAAVRRAAGSASCARPAARPDSSRTGR